MGFWIFMLIADLLVPFSMIGFGRYFLKNGGPKEINMVFGYRTAMSMKKDTWRFAHKHCGKSWWTVGWILLALSIVAMLFVFGKEIGTVGTFGGILCLVQIVPLIGSIIPTEIALRKNFDKNGNRIMDVSQ